MTILFDTSLPDLLWVRLLEPLPGREAQAVYSHALSYGRPLAGLTIVRHSIPTRTRWFRWLSYDIWGAMSMILEELKAVLTRNE